MLTAVNNQPLCRYLNKVLRVATATSAGLCNDSWIILYMKRYHMLIYLLVQGSAHHCFAVAQNDHFLGSAILILSVLILC